MSLNLTGPFEFLQAVQILNDISGDYIEQQFTTNSNKLCTIKHISIVPYDKDFYISYNDLYFKAMNRMVSMEEPIKLLKTYTGSEWTIVAHCQLKGELGISVAHINIKKIEIGDKPTYLFDMLSM